MATMTTTTEITTEITTTGNILPINEILLNIHLIQQQKTNQINLNLIPSLSSPSNLNLNLNSQTTTQQQQQTQQQINKQQAYLHYIDI